MDLARFADSPVGTLTSISGYDSMLKREYRRRHRPSAGLGATQAGDRTIVLYACVPREGLGLVRLLGRVPNDA